MHLSLPVMGIIAVALLFDFSNGFHDAANSIATVVSTRVLPPRLAVLWAAVFNFVAFLVFGVHVAKTIGKGVVDPVSVTPALILAAVLGALAWNIITWWLGLPTSSSHALIGGLAGAAFVSAGQKAVLLPGLIKIAQWIVFAPVIGLAGGFLIMLGVLWACRNSTPMRVDGTFRRLQLASAAAYSLGHGGNDAQKTMGIITALLYATGSLTGEFHVPLWVVLISHGAIALGTLTGGWRIVKTMGMNITKLRPVGGFCAEAAGALTLFGATAAGIPVSTTHTITGAIVGVGVSSTQKFSAVKWGVAGRIVWAWLLTMPMAAGLAALMWFAVHALGVH
jgi:inorganic phosphate transporter, PiT family